MNAGTAACDRCRGLFEPLSRQASQNSMGPWFIRDEANPFLPGCSLQTLRALIRRGKVTRDTILRGPSTRQFWTFARNAPGIGNLLGECHACHADASPDDSACGACGASFDVIADRERLGLSDVRLLPGHAAPEQIAAASGPGARLEVAQASNGEKKHAATRPIVGVDDPAEAQAFIASRLRQRRAQRRTTLVLVLVLVGVALLAGGAWVVANLGLFQASAATSNTVPNPNNPTPSQVDQATIAPEVVDPGPAERVIPKPGEADQIGDDAGEAIEELLGELESDDLSRVRAALASPRLSGLKSDSRVGGVVRIAEERVRIALLEGRL